MPAPSTRDFPRCFPLGLVALPTESVPLHIFEDRYLRMIAHCMEGEGQRVSGSSGSPTRSSSRPAAPARVEAGTRAPPRRAAEHPRARHAPVRAPRAPGRAPLSGRSRRVPEARRRRRKTSRRAPRRASSTASWSLRRPTASSRSTSWPSWTPTGWRGTVEFRAAGQAAAAGAALGERAAAPAGKRCSLPRSSASSCSSAPRFGPSPMGKVRFG